MPSTPSERSLQGRGAAHKRWAGEDPAAHTSKMRAAFDKRFYEGIPDDLPQSERDRRATSARKAYFAQLALKSAQARRRAS